MVASPTLNALAVPHGPHSQSHPAQPPAQPPPLAQPYALITSTTAARCTVAVSPILHVLAVPHGQPSRSPRAPRRQQLSLLSPARQRLVAPQFVQTISIAAARSRASASWTKAVPPTVSSQPPSSHPHAQPPQPQNATQSASTKSTAAAKNTAAASLTQPAPAVLRGPHSARPHAHLAPVRARFMSQQSRPRHIRRQRWRLIPSQRTLASHRTPSQLRLLRRL